MGKHRRQTRVALVSGAADHCSNRIENAGSLGASPWLAMGQNAEGRYGLKGMGTAAFLTFYNIITGFPSNCQIWKNGYTMSLQQSGLRTILCAEVVK